jgi:hypothetical protein
MSQDNADNLSKKRSPYWIPGVNGIVLEEALALMAYGKKAMRLTITKIRTAPKPSDDDDEQGVHQFSFHIDVKDLDK